jgi:hypothetical protein
MFEVKVQVLVKKRKQFITMFICILPIASILFVVRPQQRVQQHTAKQILYATGVKGGLIVHVGCGDGKLTAALRASDGYLIHGLDADARNVEKPVSIFVHLESIAGYRLNTGTRITLHMLITWSIC